ncbi:hypothetical protein 278BB001_102 [Bacillus phage 278BB001]|nr:hypothetical protein 010DV004_110 [Bacillus phage 010DV004]QZA69327.1 hypothetical protein 010DV005_110 [Bacillus phage 010DV005]QZA70253.1 hypothetical protein 278BB001_102 [Bacillus phage 278BB001]
MSDFKQFVLCKLEVLHLNLFYNNPYDLNSTKGITDRLEDLVRYEQLKEVVRENPEWDDTEMAKELSARINKRTSLR